MGSYGGGGSKTATVAEEDDSLAGWSSDDSDIGIEDGDFWRDMVESWVERGRETPSQTVPDASPREKKPPVETANSLTGGEDDIEMREVAMAL
jgi:hypothetical protein